MPKRFDLGDALASILGSDSPLVMLSVRVREENMQYSKDQVDWFDMGYLLEKGESLHTYPHRRILFGNRVYPV